MPRRPEGVVRHDAAGHLAAAGPHELCHRPPLSTVRNADLILVLNRGDSVEQGTHDEMLAQDGFYAKLYNSQFAAKALAAEEDFRVDNV